LIYLSQILRGISPELSLLDLAGETNEGSTSSCSRVLLRWPQ
jgi:hypothetical protein